VVGLYRLYVLPTNMFSLAKMRISMNSVKKNYMKVFQFSETSGPRG